MLSILLPSRNEPKVHEFIKELEGKVPVTEIIICNDRESKGKGWALREAFQQSTGDLICFIDGDGDVCARMILRLLPFAEDFPVVVSSKRITKSPFRRKVMTHLTRIWFKILFGIYVDSQTGLKVFHRSALESLEGSWESQKWIFDVEIIARLQKKGFKMVEVPIEVEIKKQLAIKTIFRIFGESLWLKYRLMVRK